MTLAFIGPQNLDPRNLDHLSAERARDVIVPQEQRGHAAGRSLSFASVLVAVLVAHAAILAFLNVFEIAPARPDAAHEIPVELVSEAEAEKSEVPQAKPPGQDQKAKESSVKDQNKIADTPPKPEAQKPEPAKPEPPKQEPATQEPAKQDPPKQEPPKQEAAKPEPPKQEPPKQEPAKPEPPKPEPAKPDPPKPESAKQEPPKQEAPKQEPAKPDARKSAAQKKEAQKPAPKKLAANPEAMRQAVENAEAAKAAAADRVQAQLPPGRGNQAAQQPLAPPDPNAHGSLPAPFDPVPDIFKAMAVPQSSETGEDLVSYSTLVFSRLELSKTYPEAALARGTEGSAGIGFTLDDDGNVLDVELLVSSGDNDLDEESVALVRRAAPFPAPPPGAKHRFDAVVSFAHR
jgi:TonB family protein